jgi:hypothetical protein
LYVGTDPTQGMTYPLTTMRTAVSGHTVSFGPTADRVCPNKATYRWAVSGPTLDFTRIKDACGNRMVLMTAGRFTREH